MWNWGDRTSAAVASLFGRTLPFVLIFVNNEPSTCWRTRQSISSLLWQNGVFSFPRDPQKAQIYTLNSSRRNWDKPLRQRGDNSCPLEFSTFAVPRALPSSRVKIIPPMSRISIRWNQTRFLVQRLFTCTCAFFHILNLFNCEFAEV